MAFLLDDTTLKVENYIIVIEFYKLEFVNTYYHKDIYLKFSIVFRNIL